MDRKNVLIHIPCQEYIFQTTIVFFYYFKKQIVFSTMEVDRKTVKICKHLWKFFKNFYLAFFTVKRHCFDESGFFKQQ